MQAEYKGNRWLGSILGWGLVGVIAAAGGVTWIIQRVETARLRAGIAALRAESSAADRVRAEHRRLMDAQPSAVELALLRADHAALARLRAEVDAVKRRAAESAAQDGSPVASQSRLPAPPEMVSAAAWRNRGRATPRDALETMLWAAAGGDLDAVVETILLEPGARRRAGAVWRELPAATRARFESPEHLVALFTAGAVPAEGRMRVILQTGGRGDEARLLVSLHGETAPPATYFALRRLADGWKLVVPVSAVEKYAAAMAP